MTLLATIIQPVIGMLVQKVQIVISYEPLVWTRNPVLGFTWFGKILSTCKRMQ